MRFGMLHLFDNPVGRTEHEVIGEQLERMRVAEDLGFDSPGSCCWSAKP
jgi:hypothetical protein